MYNAQTYLNKIPQINDGHAEDNTEDDDKASEENDVK
jgi:hypothetical protein